MKKKSTRKLKVQISNCRTKMMISIGKYLTQFHSRKNNKCPINKLLRCFMIQTIALTMHLKKVPGSKLKTSMPQATIFRRIEIDLLRFNNGARAVKIFLLRKLEKRISSDLARKAAVKRRLNCQVMLL